MAQLTKLLVERAREPGRYGDGAQGLWLQVTAAGTKSWLLRYQVNGRPRHMGLGPVSVVSLHEARLRARCRPVADPATAPIPSTIAGTAG